MNNDNDESLIGFGGQSDVFKARRKSDGKMVALKPTDPMKEDERQCVINECSLNQYLQCEQLIKVFEVYDYRNSIMVFMELMDGDMSDIIRQNKGTLSEEFCKWTLYQTAKGLYAMHLKNVLHRDIKPANILMKGNGDVKVCDLGLSVFLSEQE